MRVCSKALAPLSLLSLLAACVTPPPFGGYEQESYAQAPPPDDRGYVRSAGYEPAAQEYGYDDRGYERVPPHELGRYERAPYGRISFLLGKRNMTDEFFEAPQVEGTSITGQSVDQPGMIGVEFSQIPAPGMLGFEFGVQFANDRERDAAGRDTELSQAEIYAGVRAEFGRGRVRPFIGGGGVLLSSTLTQETGLFGTDPETDDSAFGAYIHGGIHADISDYVFVGVDFRHVFGTEYEFGNIEVDSDYDQLSVVLGLTL